MASSPPLAQKLTADAGSHKSAQSSVTCVYQSHIGGCWRSITVLWTKNMMNYSLIMSVDSMESNQHHTFKVDLKPWHFWSRKGYKSFQVDGYQLEAFWDFRAARFSGSPEPWSDYYVALVSDGEVALLLGDLKKKAYKKTKSRPALFDAFLIYKKEHVFGKKSFSTRASFDHRTKEHDIVVESSTSGPKDPEMWISVDGIVQINIKNLQWKFRGNETITINKQAVQVFWDVYGWLFCDPGSNHGLFIFKPCVTESECDKDDSSSVHGNGSDCSGESMYYSTVGQSKETQFSLFLYAWKVE
ncbi:hypothetical protein DCAR_0522070 [Daucus carota subsp. sativus]|uniref:Uncharacterized protein n=1 Tax=Daucus carota subsp. sativus TaxID=79200 RepID=A0A164ZKA1_DAUCS|nr:PREDICTED: uncharacterized protein LOC108221809 [Daucus carota subsp. sativus]WOH02681.1 hypothetical protein DCAR_0522070 [Daucus carota subsp. sativus]